jgi:putative transcriptional regulator
MVKLKQSGEYNRIKIVLEQKEKDQIWLTEKLDLQYETINRYCNNRRQPTLATLFEIAALLDVLPSKLLNEKLVIK